MVPSGPAVSVPGVRGGVEMGGGFGGLGGWLALAAAALVEC